MTKAAAVLVVALLLAACGGDDEPEPTALGDGRQAVHILRADVYERHVVVDPIDFLTGQEAINAYHEDNPQDPEGPPNDYYIVNDTQERLTVPVAEEARIRVTTSDAGGELVPAGMPALEDLTDRPFWITLDDGIATVIEEQFVP